MGRFKESAEMFRWSAERLHNRIDEQDEQRQRLYAVCRVVQANCMLGQPEGKRLAQESIAILQSFSHSKEFLHAVGLMFDLATDYHERERLAQEALALSRQKGLVRWTHHYMLVLADLAFEREDYAEAKELAFRVIAMCRETNDHIELRHACMTLCNLAMGQRGFAEAAQFAQAALAACEEIGFRSGTWWPRSILGQIARVQQDYLTAKHHYQEGLNVCQAFDDQPGAASALAGLGSAVSGLGDDDAARNYLCDALKSVERFDVRVKQEVLLAVAEYMANRGNKEHAVELFSFYFNAPNVSQIGRIWVSHMLEPLRRTMTPNLYIEAMERGKSLNVDSTIVALLAALSQPSRVNTPISPKVSLPTLSDPLTERETEVLRFIAEGLSNHDIALRLFVGVSTVKTHINHLYSKLCVKNRTQAVARARELSILP